MLDTATAAIIAGLGTGVGSWFVAARRFSGKIESSDAKELWTESRSIREWSHEQLELLTEEVRRLQAQVIELSLSNVKLREELSAAYLRINELEKGVNGHS